jgi:small subunit ribosomal protein S15
LHSKKGGKSGSKRPVAKAPPTWVEASAPEVEELVINMGKQGMSKAAIGQNLRDTHGIPSVFNLTGKSVTQILTEGGIKAEYPEDLLNLITTAVIVRRHMKTNRRDIHNRVKLGHIEAKIKRLVLYYRRTGAIPKKWSYDPESAALLVK